jgi:hypothetical protein
MTGRRQDAVVLDLFCGFGGVAKQCNVIGARAIMFDKVLSPKCDLCHVEFLQYLKAQLESNKVGAVMLATPCSSFSLAQSRSGYAIRSIQHPEGLPNLTGEQQNRVREGNRLANATIKILKLCITNNVPAILENPPSSFLWKYPALAPLLAKGDHRTVHMCAFGARWRKAAGVHFFNYR